MASRSRAGRLSGIRTQARRGCVSPASSTGWVETPSLGSEARGEDPRCARVCAAAPQPIARAIAASTRRVLHLQLCSGCRSPPAPHTGRRMSAAKACLAGRQAVAALGGLRMPLPALAPGHRGREGRGGGSGDEFGRDGVGVWVGTRVAQGSPGTTSWALRAQLILCIAVLKFLSF